MKKIAIGIIVIAIAFFAVTSLINTGGSGLMKAECKLFIDGKKTDMASFSLGMYDRVDELSKKIKPEDKNSALEGLSKEQIMVNICKQTQEYDELGGSTTDNFDKATYKVLSKD
ncbi:hypothetical protein [Sulfurimonas sp.]|uniref:hypothetical protein n=1 Tax=Sulfurimonas sp. TaxID=2022749 RepID=UPI0025EA5B48|nr:hypothetical protein [Sulfurimonas sp.]